jgi:hypothetical protein
MAENINFIASSETPSTIEFTVPVGGIEAGNFIGVQDVWGLSYKTYTVDGSTGVAVVKVGKARVFKKTGAGEAVEIGDNVFLDTNPVNLNISATNPGGYIYVGTAIRAATIDNETVMIAFDGTKGILQ